MKPWQLAQASITRLSYTSKKLDLSHFTLIAECRKGFICYEKIKIFTNENDVYALQFGDDLYIGSSKNISQRIRSHFKALVNGTHTSKRVQNAYNREMGFKAYILMRCHGRLCNAEQMMIRLLQPSLNTLLPNGNCDYYNNIIWVSKDCDMLSLGYDKL